MTNADVVVIGAGLAGLRCAVDLARGGATVVVLEARDRVGGRVWSHRFDDGQVCERGAEFVDSNHTEVLALAADLGLVVSERVSDLDHRASLVDAGGRAAPFDFYGSLVDDVSRYESALQALDPSTTPDDASLADLVASLGLSLMGRVVVGRDIRTEFMLPPEEVSLRFAAHVTRQQKAGSREVHRIVGGNDQLAAGLAERAVSAGVRLVTGAVVRSVDAPNGRLSVVASDPSIGNELVAGVVVAAVPVPVLNRLWGEIPAALGSLAYGIGGKVSVHARRRVWRDLGRNGTVFSDRQFGHLWETTDDQLGDAGVLTALLSSHDGAAFAAMPEAPDVIVREINRLFPGTAGLIDARVHTDWTNDPFSLGCYSCPSPGQWVPARTVLREPHGRLVLAGEHTDEFTGYMEGALRSGARAAAQAREIVAGGA